MKFLLTLFVCLGITAAFASAATHYELQLDRPAVVAGTELPSGTYQLELMGDKVMIHGGKMSVEAPVKMEEGAKKYSQTAVGYTDANGKYRIAYISLRGTKNRVVFEN